MNDVNAFEQSKWNDEHCMLPYLSERWSGKRTGISWHVTLDSSEADFAGSDIECIDWYASDKMRDGRGRLVYDTKYLRKDYAWFPIEKFDPYGKSVKLITTNYIYVWKDIAVMFPRDKALALCTEKAYETRDKVHKSGYVSRICTIPKADLLGLDGFVVLGKYGPKDDRKPGFIEKYGTVLKGDLKEWLN